MPGKDLKSVTIKDVFEKTFGKEEGRAVLAEIQAAYDKGLTGTELKKKADEIVSKRKPLVGPKEAVEPVSTGACASTAIVVPAF